MSTTYEFYTETFFGKKIPESDFDYYDARAEEYISARCGGLPDTENIGKAVCAANPSASVSSPGKTTDDMKCSYSVSLIQF